VACCSKSSGDREVKSCPVCGTTVPPSLGYKPRTYCSAVCRVARRRKPRPAVSACELCCRPAPQGSRGPRRRFCSKLCQSRAYYAKKPKKPRVKKSRPQATCAQCGDVFEVVKSGQKLCSAKCRNNYTAARNVKNGSTYRCLCCSRPFRKRGTGRNAGKYCSRECAFDARRRKLPCASRPLEVARQLAGWFLEWHREATEPPSHEAIACARCGERAVVGFGSGKAMCDRCQSLRFCSACGCESEPRRHLCRQCAKDRHIKRLRESKRRRRRLYGHACTFRQRCKKYGATYTKVSKKVVMDLANWMCQICGCELLSSFTVLPGTRTPHPCCPTIDHIVPLSFGASGPGHVLGNCQAACWRCNCLRGAEPLDSFVQRYTTSLD
jgi:hypothetical protein